MTVAKEFLNTSDSVKSLIESSELKYKSGDYKGSINDRRKAKKLIGSNDRFQLLIREFKSKYESKYDLIEDYKRRINDSKKIEIIIKLETISEYKFNSEDYKGSIRAIRRAEKYY